MEKKGKNEHPILIMHWHNETRELLKEFSDLRMKFMQLIRAKIK
jgi:hypothetical protein